MKPRLVCLLIKDDIGAHRVGHDKDILHDDAHPLAQSPQRQLANILAVDKNRALHRIVETDQQRDQG